MFLHRCHSFLALRVVDRDVGSVGRLGSDKPVKGELIFYAFIFHSFPLIYNLYPALNPCCQGARNLKASLRIWPFPYSMLIHPRRCFPPRRCAQEI